MQKLNINRVGQTMSAFVGLVHLLWVTVVGMGFAGAKLNFFLGMHFLSVPFTVLNFSWTGGLILVILSMIGGYIIGSVFAFIWNKVGAR